MVEGFSLTRFPSFRADPLSNMLLSFASKEDAVAFAEKNGKATTHLGGARCFLMLPRSTPEVTLVNTTAPPHFTLAVTCI